MPKKNDKEQPHCLLGHSCDSDAEDRGERSQNRTLVTASGDNVDNCITLENQPPSQALVSVFMQVPNWDISLANAYRA